MTELARRLTRLIHFVTPLTATGVAGQWTREYSDPVYSYWAEYVPKNYQYNVGMQVMTGVTAEFTIRAPAEIYFLQSSTEYYVMMELGSTVKKKVYYKILTVTDSHREFLKLSCEEEDRS